MPPVPYAFLANSKGSASSGLEGEISSRARDLHFRSLVIDAHVDTTQRLLDPGFNIGIRQSDGNIDIPRLREGGIGGIFFAIWVPGTVTRQTAVACARKQIESVHEMVRRHPTDLVFCRTANELRGAHAAGKIATLMGLEGGHMIDSDLGILREYASLGMCYMTLTHNLNVEWADSSTDEPAHNGLSEFGREVVREMNRLGMLVDISHVSDKTFRDAIEVSEAPLIASHSSCRALCDSARDLHDDAIQMLAAKGGVVHINYHVGFLSQDFRNALDENPDLATFVTNEVTNRLGENQACQLVEAEKITRQLVEEGKLPRVGWEMIVEHLDHAIKLVGSDHVGLGSDFDGANMPYGMDDVTQIPKITDALLRTGYSEAEIQKILGGNTLRLMEQVTNTAKKLGGKS